MSLLHISQQHTMGFNFVSILIIAYALLFIANALSTESDAEDIYAADSTTTDGYFTSNVSNDQLLSIINDQVDTLRINKSNISIKPSLYPEEVNYNIQDKKSDASKKVSTKKSIDGKDVRVFRLRERNLRFPKLKKVNATTTAAAKAAAQKTRIGYASSLQTRQTQINATTLAPIQKIVRKPSDKLQRNNNSHYDVFEISSSDHSPTIAFYIPRQSAANSFRSSRLILGAIKPDNSTKFKRIPKLLLPRNLRPAMYSLHGFVPRPSLNKIATTEAPTTPKSIDFSSQRIRNNNKKPKLETPTTPASKIRKYGATRVEPKITDKLDDIEVSGSRRRNVIAKRKGLLTPAASQPKPNIHRTIINKRIGLAGKDYPTLNSVPKTGFDCTDVSSGVYADLETGCQVWHICQGSRKHSFLCPNGTVFNERNTICDWWYNVECPKPVHLQDDTGDNKQSERTYLKKSKRRRII